MTYDEALQEAKKLNPAKLRRFAAVCEGQANALLAEVYDEPIYNQSNRLRAASDLLRAADVFRGKANSLSFEDANTEAA